MKVSVGSRAERRPTARWWLPIPGGAGCAAGSTQRPKRRLEDGREALDSSASITPPATKDTCQPRAGLRPRCRAVPTTGEGRSGHSSSRSDPTLPRMVARAFFLTSLTRSMICSAAFAATPVAPVQGHALTVTAPARRSPPMPRSSQHRLALFGPNSVIQLRHASAPWPPVPVAQHGGCGRVAKCSSAFSDRVVQCGWRGGRVSVSIDQLHPRPTLGAA